MLDFQSVVIGQLCRNFDYKDFLIVKKVRRLALRHLQLCEYSNSGEGWIKGCHYTLDNPTTYIGKDSVFDLEIVKIENKIEKILKNSHLRVECQRNPREATVKLFYKKCLIKYI